ncbi:MAG: hypothetical protein ACF8PN_02415 [Phycisphaerales bacterium]
METALAIVIVSTGVLSIIYAQQAFLQENDWSSRLSTATYLANEVREMTIRLPRHDPVTWTAYWGPEPNELNLEDFDDLDDFDGADGLGLTYAALDATGPVNARREVIPNMQGWSQYIRVFNVDPMDIAAPGDPLMDGQTTMMRVEVVVSYQGPLDAEPGEITRVSWISRY